MSTKWSLSKSNLGFTPCSGRTKWVLWLLFRSVSEQDRALSWFVSSCCKSSFLNMMSGQGKALLKCCQCCRNVHQQGSLSVNENLLCWRSAHMREIGFRTESGKFLLVEFGILGFRMRNTSQTLKNSESTNDWNPESKCYWQRLESSSWTPEFVTWNPESKCVLDSLRARFRTLVYFFLSPFPLPCAWGQKIPPGFYFRTRAWPSQKRKSEVLWTGYRNSSYSFVAGCCFSIVLCVLLSHDSRVSRAPYFGSCVALGYESPIFHRASEILRRAWKSPPVRMVTCWPAQPGILPWGKMWGEGGGHTWIPPIRPSSVIGKTNTNWNLFVKLMIIYRLNKIRKRLSIHTMPCESDRDVRGGIVQS